MKFKISRAYFGESAMHSTAFCRTTRPAECILSKTASRRLEMAVPGFAVDHLIHKVDEICENAEAERIVNRMRRRLNTCV